MTIIYQYKVASTSFFGFFKLLRRWRGSVYKLIYKETIIFLGLYALISMVYRLALNSDQRRAFEQIVVYCNSYTNLIPVSFVLGFYVSLIVNRWWTQFTNVPWPDRTLYVMGSYLVGRDEHTRMVRRTVARYMLSSLVLILRSVSVSVMKRYPTMEHIVDAGFLTPEEVSMFEKVECQYNKFWVPLVWANSVLTQERKDGRIDSDIGFRLLLEQIADFRDKCSICFVYDWITIPLVYTQVVTLAVYIFFGACLIGRQYVDNDESLDLYVPIFTLLQFFFYMGWLKVAEQLINPFGEDDDDFDMNWLLDRHTSVAMCLVDFCHDIRPPLVKDAHFDDVKMENLPYTEASLGSIRPNFLGSTYNLARPSRMESRIVPPSGLLEVPMSGGLRRRADTGPRLGSVWSLFGYKPNLHKDSSRESMFVGNGHTGMGSLSGTNYVDPVQREHRDSKGSEASFVSRPDSSVSEILPPEYVPLRRAQTDSNPHKPLRRVVDGDRERKWSFPLNLLRKKQERDVRVSDRDLAMSKTSIDSAATVDDNLPLLTPQTQPKSRFHVEAVPGDHDVDASKAARNKQIIDKHIAHMAVSRPPVLSAIEEGNTIRSVKEIVSPSHSSHSLDVVDETLHINDGEIPIPTTIMEEDIPFASRDGDVTKSHDSVFQSLDVLDDIHDGGTDSGLDQDDDIRFGRMRSVSECDDVSRAYQQSLGNHDNTRTRNSQKPDTNTEHIMVAQSKPDTRVVSPGTFQEHVGDQSLGFDKSNMAHDRTGENFDSFSGDIDRQRTISGGADNNLDHENYADSDNEVFINEHMALLSQSENSFNYSRNKTKKRHNHSNATNKTEDGTNNSDGQRNDDNNTKQEGSDTRLAYNSQNGNTTGTQQHVIPQITIDQA